MLCDPTTTGFGSATAAAHEWWLENKCHAKPAAGSDGWKIFGFLSRWKFKRRYVAELERRVAKLSATEPASSRLKLNERMLAAASRDAACFADPAWPASRTCGGSREVSQWMQYFVKFYLGFAGARPADDIPVIGPPRGGAGPNVAKGDTVQLRFALRGWIGGANMLAMAPEEVDAHFARLEDGGGRAPYGERRATVTLGGGALVAGLENAIASKMRRGERKVVLVPPREAYGDEGRGPIPGGAHLVVDVQVLTTDEAALVTA